MKEKDLHGNSFHRFQKITLPAEWGRSVFGKGVAIVFMYGLQRFTEVGECVGHGYGVESREGTEAY